MTNCPLITTSVIKYMESNILDFIKRKRLTESSTIKEFYLPNLSTTKLNEKYRMNVGNSFIAMNGKIVTLDSNITNYHFQANLPLFCYRQNDTPKLYTLYDRGMESKVGMTIYINGVKVPDKKAYIYISQSGTDIIVPTKYFDKETDNELVCIIKDYSSLQYDYFYNEFQSGISISFTTKIYNINKKHVNIWINGIYLYSNEYEIYSDSQGNCEVVLNIESIPNVYEIEIFMDETQIDKYNTNYLGQNRFYIYVPKHSNAVIETSIFVNMCDVFINGLKISSHNLSQKTHRHILYAGNEVYDDTVKSEIIVSDKKPYIHSFADYINLFMEYEYWVDENKNLISINDEDTATYPIVNPGFVSYKTLSFPDVPNYYNIDTAIDSGLPLEQKAELMILENKHYLKNLLKYYAIPEEKYYATVSSPSSSKYISILLDRDATDDRNIYTRNVELYTNSLKITNDKCSYETHLGGDIVKIDTSTLKPNVRNEILLYKSRVENTRISPYIKFSITETSIGKTNYKIKNFVDLEGNLEEYDITELKLFRQIPYSILDKYHLFLKHPDLDSKENSLYYEFIKQESNYSLSIDNDNDLCITIPTDSSLKDNDIIIIANPRYHEQICLKIKTDEDYDSQFRLILNSVHNNEILPFVKDEYLMKVFLNGVILVPGLDYVYSSPEEYDRLTSSQIIFRRRINYNDVIEVVMTGIKNKCYASYDIIPVTNKYGFIFFDKLDIPFDMSYMDLYVNDEKLRSDEVIVYTDRLIRIKKSRPYKSIVLFTRLKKGLDQFTRYINAAKQQDCDFDSYIRKFCRDVIFDDTSILPPKDLDIQDVFKFEYDETQDKTENPINPDFERTKRFNTFLDRLTRDFNSGKNLITKFLDSNTTKDFDIAEYVILMSQKERETGTIIFDADTYESISEDLLIDPNVYCRTNADISVLLRDTFREKNYLFDSNKTYDEWVDPLFLYMLYYNDVEPLDANRDFADGKFIEPDGIIFDCNVEVQN